MTNNEAIKWLNNLMSDLGNPHYECLWPYAQAIYEICELLKEQPDVVRCKDCKYWHDPIRCQLDSEGLKTLEDWFCADGERR